MTKLWNVLSRGLHDTVASLERLRYLSIFDSNKGRKYKHYKWSPGIGTRNIKHIHSSTWGKGLPWHWGTSAKLRDTLWLQTRYAEPTDLLKRMIFLFHMFNNRKYVPYEEHFLSERLKKKNHYFRLINYSLTQLQIWKFCDFILINKHLMLFSTNSYWLKKKRKWTNEKRFLNAIKQLSSISPFSIVLAFFKEIYLLLVYLVTALVPSLTACFASSPGKSSLMAVCISRELIVDFLL